MARLIQFEGRQIEMPDDATDDEVAAALSAGPAPPPVLPDRPQITVTPRPAQPSFLQRAGRATAIGAQGIGAGAADIAGMPVDLTTGLINAGIGGVNLATGAEIPTIQKPFLGSESIRDTGGRLASYLGFPSVPDDQRTPVEDLSYNINRFATQGLGLGSSIAATAPALAARVAQGVKPPGIVGRVGDLFRRQYIDAPASTVAGDVAAGAGAGAGVDYAQKNVEPDSSWRPLAEMGGALAGGTGGAMLKSIGEGLGGMLRSFFMNRVGDPNVPYNPGTNAPFTRAETEQAARKFQDYALNPARASDELRAGSRDLSQAGVAADEMPTSGLLSRDPGLVSQEYNRARTQNGVPFIERDQNVKQAAADRVASLQDPTADQGAVRAVAQGEATRREGVAQSFVDSAAQADQAAQAARQQEGAHLAPIANADRRAQASRQLDKAVVEDTYLPDRARKSALYDAVDPNWREMVPADPVLEAAQRVRQNVNDLAPGGLQMPGEFVQRLEALAPQIEQRQSAVLGPDGRPVTRDVNVGGPGEVSVGQLTDLRKYLSTAREKARASGNFELADNIGTLQQSINTAVENSPAAAAATQNFRENFAPKYRAGPGDEAQKFTRAIDKDGNRTTTPPSETAGRFLSSPEKTQALQRILDGSPSAAQGQAAVRDYMRSDFAQSVLNPDGSLNPKRATAWASNNADVLAQFPQLRAEFDGLAAQARRGESLTTQTKAQLAAAQKAQKATQQEVDRSVLGTLLKEDPRDVVASLLNGGYGAERKLEQIEKLIANDPQATKGWRSAVTETLADRVMSTRQAGETYEVQYQRLAKEFKDNETLLAKTLTPEEMNTLRQAHKLLGYFKEAEKRASIGSNTADKVGDVPGWIQLAARHVYGDLRGGGIVRRFRLFMSLLPNDSVAVNELTRQAWFDPEVAAYLLDRPVQPMGGAPYNVNLKRLIAADAGSRSGSESE